MAKEKTKDKARLFCSFCRKSAKEIPSLLGGPAAYICGDCVKVCNSILAGLPTDGFGGWETLKDDDLLANLDRSQAAFEGARAVLQQQIDVLRKRDVSWQRIGDALGTSRQAAWERFG
jgi:ClpX C4-type zinc finger